MENNSLSSKPVDIGGAVKIKLEVGYIIAAFGHGSILFVHPINRKDLLPWQWSGTTIPLAGLINGHMEKGEIKRENEQEK